MKIRFNFLKKFIFFWLIFTIFSVSYAVAPKNFKMAKRAAKKIFSDHRITLYCFCDYSKGGKIDHKSCSMKPTKSLKRAHRLEFEHIMPMSNVTKQFECGTKPICKRQNGTTFMGRECCRKISPKYRRIEGELFNLYPVVGSVNEARANYRYTDFGVLNKKEKYNFDGCRVIVDHKNRQFEPPDEVKGLVARANLFMSKKHGISLSGAQRKLFKAWNKKYPPTAWEIEWEKRVFKVTNYHNDFIRKYKYEDKDEDKDENKDKEKEEADS